ncbi:MAG TPA: hypothetical protein DCX07_01995 [Phycisphaerales bacterium]|nr:hypothetical protein [Phycisphaerales bacterium]
MIDLRNEDKVAILLQLEKTATSQMMENKREEMSWLKVFLLFYGALVAWSAQRWLAQAQVNAQDAGLVHGVLIFSLVATFVFSFLFIRTRWSYYGVSRRLLRIQSLLGLYDAETWGESDAPLGDIDRIGYVKGWRTWRENTKPFSSFTTRMIYVWGSNMTMCFIAYFALTRIDPKTSVYFLVFWLIINVFLLGLIMLIDFLHFYVPREKRN